MAITREELVSLRSLAAYVLDEYVNNYCDGEWFTGEMRDYLEDDGYRDSLADYWSACNPLLLKELLDLALEVPHESDREN